VLGHDLAAGGALHRTEDPRPLRDIRSGLFFDEELTEWNREDLLDDRSLPLLELFLLGRCSLPAHHLCAEGGGSRIEPLGEGFRALDEADRGAGLPVDEGVCVLAEVLEDQVAFPHGASRDCLYGIDPAGIVLDNRHEVFVFGAFSMEGF